MRVQAGDVRLFFEVEGAKLVPDGPAMRERPTVILLHGGPGVDHTDFRPFGSALADMAQVVYLDHRGCGRSDRSGPERWNLATWADDVRAFCDALEIQRPVVLGNSFGGMVAQAYAARYPDHPGKLILTSTTAKLRLDRMLPVFERLGGARAADIARRFFADPMPNFHDYIRVCLPLYRQTPEEEGALQGAVIHLDVGGYFVAGEMQTYDLRADLARVRCPTLVLSGDLDPFATSADARELVAALPGELVQARHFPHAGHAVLADARAEALAAIRGFLGAT
ncbi:hydrolase [Sorangium cellulosum]|uniref:Hydrolase n=1 Tax=Sorangium cellulosum TaxID=56 RepID=A0A150SCE8_SORCE|nr:hydrolase [Sorangium cellulosum]KYF94616.1 hydrolase [Sorangium cellulosum]